MTNFLQDLRYGLRMLAKNPGFALIAILTLAIGIGANTAIFSVVNAVLLRPLAIKDSDRIVTLSSLWKKSGSHGPVSGPDFHDWHDQASDFESMGYYEADDCAISSANGAQFSFCAAVTPEFFRVFLVEPAAGHFFTADEQKSGAAIVSYSYWQQRLGGDPSAIGRSFQLFGRSLNVVGITPPGFHFPDNKTDVWIPANSVFPETESRSGHNYRVVARLKPGVTTAEAQAQMTTIAARLEEAYPASNNNKSAAVVPMRDEMVRDIRLTLYLLLGAVGLVLLIACANIANLLLAKATGREREMAIRTAMGGTRGRILRQMFTESSLIALAAGAVGVAIAIFGSQVVVRLAPGNIPRLNEIGVDTRVLSFTFAISAIATLLFGIAPALHVSRVELNEALQSGTRAGSSRGTRRFHAALVVSEVALSVILMAGAGLLIRSFDALLNVQLGYHPEQIVVMESSVPSSGLDGARHATALYTQLLASATAIPGATAVSATRGIPGQASSEGGYWIDHLPSEDQQNVSAPQAVMSVSAPNYFHTMGISLVEGRDFDARDTFDAPRTAIVNEALAKQAFGKENPIGHQIFCGLDYDSLKTMTIVGVVGNVRQWGPAEAPWPEIYMPYEQHPLPSTALTLMVRTPLALGAMESPLRKALENVSPDMPARFSTMESQVSESVAAPRFRALLVAAFALLALVLAMAGIYGVMAYSVAERTREIGIRMALGAQAGGVMQLILRQGMRMVAIGLALGVAGAFASTQLLKSLLFEVKPADPVAFLGAIGVLLAIAVVANYVPARRATRVDPMIALRYE